MKKTFRTLRRFTLPVFSIVFLACLRTFGQLTRNMAWVSVVWVARGL